MKTHKTVLTGGIIFFLLVLVSAGIYIGTQDKNTLDTPTVATDSARVISPETTVTSAAPTPPTPTSDLLLYLIEEEKLAHDVYTVMYSLYGSNVFGNILESETTHQDKVLAILQSRNIADPRSDQVGVFVNTDLQTLYDTLVAQGTESLEGALRAGVAIEEKDIADISAQLATATDEDVISTLELLRKGSENHLRAFNKQLQ